LNKDLEAEAKEVLQKYGQIYPGTSTADFTVTKIDDGWIVSGDQPGIINYVSEDEGKGKEDFELGLIGRNQKELDSKELKIIYTIRIFYVAVVDKRFLLLHAFQKTDKREIKTAIDRLNEYKQRQN